jgi:hypothetical protein
MQGGKTALSLANERLFGLGTQELALARPLWECKNLLAK